MPHEEGIRVEVNAGATVGQSTAVGPSGRGLQPEVVERLYAEHALALSALVWGILRNRDSVAEVVQSTFARALECGGEVVPEKQKAWLFQVGVNAALLVKRREVTGQKAVERKIEADGWTSRRNDRSSEGDRSHGRYSVESGASRSDLGGNDSSNSLPAGLEGLIREELVEQVRRGLTTLPTDQQIVVRKKLFEEKTFREIAEELGVPEGTVVTRLRLALEKLRKLVD